MNRIPRQWVFMNIWDFRLIKRTDHDEEGNPYPLLYMRLSR